MTKYIMWFLIGAYCLLLYLKAFVHKISFPIDVYHPDPWDPYFMLVIALMSFFTMFECIRTGRIDFTMRNFRLGGGFFGSYFIYRSDYPIIFWVYVLSCLVFGVFMFWGECAFDHPDSIFYIISGLSTAILFVYYFFLIVIKKEKDMDCRSGDYVNDPKNIKNNTKGGWVILLALAIVTGLIIWAMIKVKAFLVLFG